MPQYFFTLAHFCETHGPVPLLTTRRRRVPQSSLPPPSTANSNTCKSCQLSLPSKVNQQRLLSKLSNSESYLSTRNFNDPIINTKIKMIVNRSLSEEASSNICCFGDTNIMYSISQRFSLGDMKARGKLRSFALIIICDNQNQLLINFQKISKFFSFLTKVLKKKQYLQNAKELKILNINVNDLIKEDLESIEFDDDLINNNKDLKNYHFHEIIRTQEVELRNLSDIVGDEEIYIRIHSVAVKFLSELYNN